MISAIADDMVKQRVKDETTAAVAKGVFGSPFIIVDGEQFWGADRIWLLEETLANAGLAKSEAS